MLINCTLNASVHDMIAQKYKQRQQQQSFLNVCGVPCSWHPNTLVSAQKAKLDRRSSYSCTKSVRGDNSSYTTTRKLLYSDFFFFFIVKRTNKHARVQKILQLEQKKFRFSPLQLCTALTPTMFYSVFAALCAHEENSSS